MRQLATTWEDIRKLIEQDPTVELRLKVIALERLLAEAEAKLDQSQTAEATFTQDGRIPEEQEVGQK